MRAIATISIVALALAVSLPAPAQVRSRSSEIQRLLDERAAAVIRGDGDAFLATVDPASEGFRTSQRDWFERIRAVPLDDYSLRLDLDDAPEFTRKRDSERHSSPVIVALVEERFRIRGFDDRPALSNSFYTFVEKQGRWVIASDSDLEDVGLFSSRQPWDFGPIQIRDSEHFMIVTHPQESALAQQLLSLAEGALPAVGRAWKLPWNKKVVIFVPSSQKELERLLDATFDVGNFVAVAVSSVDIDEGWFPVTRVMVNPQTFLKRTPEVQRTILVHELLHVATRRASGPFLTSAVEEGLAQLAEFETPPSMEQVNVSVRRAGFDGRLPDDTDFFTGGGASIRRSYLEALSAMAYAAMQYGVDKINAFYTSFGSARIEAGTSIYHLDRALRETLGVSLADFESEWAKSVRGR